jgi:predicted AlkP superfamily phosphohydrolase/phosphomutase
MAKNKKLLVVGLDGTSWNLLNPWLAQGFLPNLQKFKTEGRWGILKSQLPPVTSPNWKCFSTGKNPAKLGVFWWENIDISKKKIYVPWASDYKSKELWDYLGKEGLSSLVINMPTTYPPKRIKGIMIAGGPGTLNNNFISPKELEKEIKDLDYKATLFVDFSNKKAMAQKIYSLIDSRFKIAQHLTQKYSFDFIMITIFYINVLHHFLWDEELTLKAWQLIDKHLGRLMEKYGNIIIVSDHGSAPIEVEFHINTWLEKNHYLKTNKNILYYLSLAGIHKRSLKKLIRIVPFSEKILNFPIADWLRPIPQKRGVSEKEAKQSLVNWEMSKALASGQGPIYLTLSSSDPNYSRLRKELKEKLERIKFPNQKETLFEKVYFKEEIYQGPYLDKAPDLIISQKPGVFINGSIGSPKVFTSPQKWKAENQNEGLWMIWGDITSKVKVNDSVSILDWCPTILDYFSVPLPQDLDGKSLILKN